jgi:beta-galactosidase
MGLRQTFVRSQHPALNGISDELLQNWHGASTLTTPYLQGLPKYEEHDPKWDWCGFENTRVWRSGNVGNTASVLIEKPVRGNWLPLIDGGFNLQYAPLLEYRDDKGIIIFCQMDISDRTEPEPVADILYRNLVTYLGKADANYARTVYYAGDDKGKKLLDQLGVNYKMYAQQKLTDKSLLVVGPDAKLKNLTELVKDGANAICLGLNAAEIKSVLPDINVKDETIYCQGIEDFSTPEFNGISNSELYWRTKLTLGAIQKTDKFSNQALKKFQAGNGTIVLSQLAPWMIDYEKYANLRIMYRRNAFLVSRILSNLGAGFDDIQLRTAFNKKTAKTKYELPQKWVGVECPNGDGEKLGWQKSTFNDSSWKSIIVPGTWEDQRKELAEYNGYFWYRIKFKTPKGMQNKELTLNIGAVDDESWIWLNDEFLGEVTKKTNPDDYYRADRIYRLKPEQLNGDGENTLVIRVGDWFKTGGIIGTPKLLIESPCRDSYYIQKPIADDDPYRYYRW